MSAKSKFYSCSCFFTNQIFLPELRLHVRYLDRSQFLSEYGEYLQTHFHIDRSEDIDQLIEEIEGEVERRKHRDADSFHRMKLIQQNYKPIHPHLWKLQDSFLAPDFKRIVTFSQEPQSTKTGLLKQLKVEDGDQLYSFPVFTEEFCRQMIEELRNFEATDLPKGRPNTMNNSGVLLDELGFYPDFITPLRENYLEHIARLLYPDWVGSGLDSHKAFIVKYQLGCDEELSYHYDNSEVTINICLGDQFQDGGLYIGPMRTEQGTRFSEYRHVIGRGLLHRGQQRHGAEPISAGERYNLIVWMRASAVRNELCPMCDQKPNLVEALEFGDGFSKDRAWCSSS